MYIREYETTMGDALPPPVSLPFSAGRLLGKFGFDLTVFEARNQGADAS
jgi:hypothetical protein